MQYIQLISMCKPLLQMGRGKGVGAVSQSSCFRNCCCCCQSLSFIVSVHVSAASVHVPPALASSALTFPRVDEPDLVYPELFRVETCEVLPCCIFKFWWTFRQNSLSHICHSHSLTPAAVIFGSESDAAEGETAGPVGETGGRASALWRDGRRQTWTPIFQEGTLELWAVDREGRGCSGAQGDALKCKPVCEIKPTLSGLDIVLNISVPTLCLFYSTQFFSFTHLIFKTLVFSNILVLLYHFWSYHAQHTQPFNIIIEYIFMIHVNLTERDLCYHSWIYVE